MEKIYHHHVPRFYLLAWADEDERVLCLGHGNIFRSKLTRVGGENHFYKLQEIAPEDISLIEKLVIDPSRPGLRQIQRNFLNAFSFPWTVKNELKDSGLNAPNAMSLVDEVIANMSEDYHKAIEDSFKPYLKYMLDGDAGFYYDKDKAGEFLYALCLQYLRTKQIREAIISNVPKPFKNIDSVWNVLTHMLAVGMGGSFFAERDQFKIVLIDNNTDVPFITGDQPIINLGAKAKETKPPEKVEFYYPLSPQKAMLFLEKSNRAHAVESSVTIDEAHSYNLLIDAHSFQQLFSNSEEYLKVIKSTREKSAAS